MIMVVLHKAFTKEFVFVASKDHSQASNTHTYANLPHTTATLTSQHSHTSNHNASNPNVPTMSPSGGGYRAPSVADSLPRGSPTALLQQPNHRMSPASIKQYNQQRPSADSPVFYGTQSLSRGNPGRFHETSHPEDRVGDANESYSGSQRELIPRASPQNMNTSVTYAQIRRPLPYDVGRVTTMDSDGNGKRTMSPAPSVSSLSELVQLMLHEKEVVRKNACAYLQHLTYKNSQLKLQFAELNGIGAILAILRAPNDSAHCHALGVLRNLTYDENAHFKRELSRQGGVQVLTDYLTREPHTYEEQDACTAVLWNLAAWAEARPAVVSLALAPLMEHVLLPNLADMSDYLAQTQQQFHDEDQLNNRRNSQQSQTQVEKFYWSTVFRNATGVLRHLSGHDSNSRHLLRQTPGLVDTLMVTVRAALGQQDLDNKCVENAVCILRNLSYACQEEVDPGYLLRRQNCNRFQNGGTMSKRNGNLFCACAACGHPEGDQNRRNMKTAPPPGVRSDATGQSPNASHIPAPPLYGAPQGMHLLWQLECVEMYLTVVKDCNNPDTLEAAVGALQNLTACDWLPSVEIRTHVRKQKGLPLLVQLLSMEQDAVVGTAALALRNLAVDERNKELIGKYAIAALVQCLPNLPSIHNDTGKGSISEPPSRSLTTIAAVLALIYTVIKGNPTFMTMLADEYGVQRCMELHRSSRYLDQSRGVNTPANEWQREQVPRFARQVLALLWASKELQPRFRQAGWKEADFGVTPQQVAADRRAAKIAASNMSTSASWSAGVSQQQSASKEFHVPQYAKVEDSAYRRGSDGNYREPANYFPLHGETNMAFSSQTNLTRPAAFQNESLERRTFSPTVYRNQVATPASEGSVIVQHPSGVVTYHPRSTPQPATQPAGAAYRPRSPETPSYVHQLERDALQENKSAAYRTTPLPSSGFNGYPTEANRTWTPPQAMPQPAGFQSPSAVNPAVVDVPLEELARQGYSYQVRSPPPAPPPTTAAVASASMTHNGKSYSPHPTMNKSDSPAMEGYLNKSYQGEVHQRDDLPPPAPARQRNGVHSDWL